MTKLLVTYDKPHLNSSDIAVLEFLLVHKIVAGIKIGITAFYTKTADGRTIADNLIDLVRRCGALWIGDVKFHDIPFQVRGATKGLITQQPNGYTAHAEGGIPMLLESLAARDEAYRSFVKTEWQKPPMFVVTVLSSLSDNAKISQLLRDIHESGAEGVVCTSKAILVSALRWHRNLLTLATSVRAPWANWIKDEDQKRSLTLQEIRTLKPTIAVLGRIVWDAPSPIEAARRIAFETR